MAKRLSIVTRHRLFYIFAMSAALLLSSCATVLDGTREEVKIDSSDPDAQLLIDGETHGFGSQSVELERDEDHVIEVIPTKGDPRRVNISPRVNLLVVFNALLPGGTVASIIDWITGAAFNLEPDEVEFDFSQPDGSQYKDQ